MRFDKFRPVVCLCSTENLHGALKAADRLSKGEDLIELVDPEKDLIDRLAPAYINAALRNSEGCMRAKDMRTEMMLFIAGKLDIRSAIDLCGAKGDRFIVFASSKKLFDAFEKAAGIKVVRAYKLGFELDVANMVASTELKSE